MIYVIATLDVENLKKLAAYREVAGAALAKHGGAIVATSAAAIALEGTPDLPDAVALISFPDKESGLGWLNDPELAETHALRRASGKTQIILLA